MDPGVIKTRMRKIISDMDDEKSTSTDVLQAMRIVDKAWRNVTTTTIENCFRSCGFLLEKDDTLIPIIQNTIADREWEVLKIRYGITEETFENYVGIDEDVAVPGIPTDDGITDSVRGTTNIDDVDEESFEPVHHVSVKRAKTTLTLLRTFSEQSI